MARIDDDEKNVLDNNQEQSEQVGNAQSTEETESQEQSEQVNNPTLTPPPSPTSNVDAVNNYYNKLNSQQKTHKTNNWIESLIGLAKAGVSLGGAMAGGLPVYEAEKDTTATLAKRYQDIYDQRQKNKDSYLTAYLNAKKADDENAQNYFLNTLKVAQLDLDNRKQEATEKYNDRRNELTEMWYTGKLSDMEYKNELAKAKLELEKLKEEHKTLKDRLDSTIAQQNADARSKDADTNRMKAEQNGGGSSGISDAYGSGNQKEKLEF